MYVQETFANAITVQLCIINGTTHQCQSVILILNPYDHYTKKISDIYVHVIL